jgi:hypothetical protein
VAGPAVAFPSEGPFHPTGPGARIVREHTQPLDHGANAQLSAVGASQGRVAVALLPPAGSALPALLEGRADGAIQGALHGSSGLALARAYLGDVAVATAEPGAISVRVQRWFGGGFERPRRIAVPPGSIGALTVTLDYRSDVLVAWQQNGSVYAHVLRASGIPQRTQRIGASAPGPQLRALVSDNDHGMVAWSTTAGSGSTARTRIELALSGPGIRFTAPVRLAAFADPLGWGRLSGSLGIVRLSTENVLLAWTAREAGRYVVRAAPAVFAATRPSALLSDPARDAVLGDLATGSTGEAVALWRASVAGAPLAADAELWAARVTLERGDRPVASSPRRVAAAGPVGQLSVAVDPASDRPLAAWRAGGARPHIEYAVGAGASGYRPRAATARAPQGSAHRLRIALAIVVFAAGLVATVLLLRARARRRVAPG